MRSSTRHWAQFFSGRPRPGFSTPAIVPNITRWVRRSLFVRCTAPAKRRRRLRMIVSTLWHCDFLRALAYDMRWSVSCRRWKPVTRRRNLCCGVRSSAKCSLPRVRVTHPYSRVSITSAFIERDSLHIVQLSLGPFVAWPCESDPSFGVWHNVGACVDKTAQIQ